MALNTVEQIARSLRQAGDAGRRVTVTGATRNAGATYAAISLARALAKDANVVLVDLAFGAPNVSIISSDPKAPGIAELVRGTASFGDIITRDQYSAAHLIATGHVGTDGSVLAASPMLATMVEALVRSYDHVVIDVGSAADIAVERFAPLADACGTGDGRPGQSGDPGRARAADDGGICRRDADGRHATGRRRLSRRLRYGRSKASPRKK